MRTLVPSSRGNFRVRFSIFDIILAAASPLLALYIRDAYILSPEGAVTVALYCSISLVFSLVGFLAFRLSDRTSYYFSVHDVMSVVQAVVISELMTSVVLFTFTRLQGVPRSTPLIHALILTAGLISVRALTSISEEEGKTSGRGSHVAIENILMIGVTRLSHIYIELLAACSRGQRRVIGVLDEKSAMTGRSIAGISVVGPLQQLDSLIDEFTVHGIRADWVIVGGDEDFLPVETLKKIRQICERREITLDFVPQLIGLRPLQSQDTKTASEKADTPAPITTSSAYFVFKRIFDFFAAVTMIIVLLPLWISVSVLVLIDVGTPVFFWQQRIGLLGRLFLLHKFRTMRPPFDWRGEPIPEEQRMSWVGHLLRETRLDEIPQLLNVLVGDMSLIGPRPLLPQDQPANPTMRLTVRPGITGWAQVNGGTLLTPNEKDRLDEWYIRNASLWLDLRIILMTLSVATRPRARLEHARADTHVVRNDRPEDLRNTFVADRPSVSLGQAQVCGCDTAEASPRLSPVHQTADAERAPRQKIRSSD